MLINQSSMETAGFCIAHIYKNKQNNELVEDQMATFHSLWIKHFLQTFDVLQEVPPPITTTTSTTGS